MAVLDRLMSAYIAKKIKEDCSTIIDSSYYLWWTEVMLQVFTEKTVDIFNMKNKLYSLCPYFFQICKHTLTDILYVNT